MEGEKGKLVFSSSEKGIEETTSVLQRSEDRESSWSESCCCSNIMRGEAHDTALRGWRKRRRDDDDDDDTVVFPSCCRKKRKHDDVSLVLINDDLLEEIMLRLPVKALTRFQVVSKHWSRMIKSKYFKDRHMSHQKTTQEPKFLCLGDDYVSLTLTTMSLDWSSMPSCLVEEGPFFHIEQPQIDQFTRVSDSCNGLVCIFDENSLTSPIIVANPAIVRSQTLPLSGFQRQWLEEKKKPALHFPGLGKDDVTGTYKLVWLHNNESNYTLSCEVFDFEVKKWRYLVNTPCDVQASAEPIFAKGWLYWIIANRTNDYNILGYDIHTEMFRVFTNTIVSQASRFYTVSICNLSDRVWVTNNVADAGGLHHFSRIKNTMDSEWESEKMFSIDLNLISPWSPLDISTLIRLKATSKEYYKKFLVSKLFTSKLVHLNPPPASILIPYFQSLDFPL
ncbi:hypothetical protein Bca52824_030413 [Brassica carinata]|uniref:F-box domain-containing protein n=1 Tax=Brassica carinata TaxID=52824 RepID=A0A8X7S8Q6_BRACI|nr:hypothetical protein Bca52824_030413 [Brassica carinata]